MMLGWDFSRDDRSSGLFGPTPSSRDATERFASEGFGIVSKSCMGS